MRSRARYESAAIRYSLKVFSSLFCFLGWVMPAFTPRKQALHDLLATLIKKFEKSTYDFAKLADDYKYGLMAGIIGFEMEIELIEGKFKLGQERSAADKESILRNLGSAKPERSIHDLTASFYQL